MGLPSCELKGLSMRRLLERSVEAGLISEVNVLSIIDRVDAKLSGIDNAALGLDMQNGRVLEFTLQHMDNGGFVLLAEDITERKAAEAEKDRLARFRLSDRPPQSRRSARPNGPSTKRMPARQHVRCSLHRS